MKQINLPLLSEAIYEGSPLSLSYFLSHYKLGFKCKDCGDHYEDCKCDYCEDCHYIRCLCNIDYYDRSEVREYAIKFAKKHLTKKDLKDLKRIVLNKIWESNLSDKEFEVQNKYFESLF